MPELVVVGQEGTGEEYLAAWIGRCVMGHGERILPVSRILRVLRYPDQAALIWPDVLCEIPPLRHGAFVRLPVIREATLSDQAALTWFRDYGASLRWAALEAIGRARTEDERIMIALQLAGRRKRQRSVYILSHLEVMEIGVDTVSRDPAGSRAAAAGPVDRQGERGAYAGGGQERRGEPDRPAGP